MRIIKLIIFSAICFFSMYFMYQHIQRWTNTTEFAPYAVGEMANLTYFDFPKPLEPIEVVLEDGSAFNIDSSGGKVRLINLWASWCTPCLVEMPALDRLQQKLGGGSFEVIAINEDFQGVTKAREFLDKLNLNHLTLYADPMMVSAAIIANNELPTSLIVDKQGRVIAKYLGPREWDSQEAIALFTYLMEKE